MDKLLDKDDFIAIESQLRVSVEAEKQYWRVNGVKCDAINTAKTYEEFSDRVAAAHLRPLDNCDYKKKCNRNWNQFASEDKKTGDE